LNEEKRYKIQFIDSEEDVTRTRLSRGVRNRSRGPFEELDAGFAPGGDDVRRLDHHVGLERRQRARRHIEPGGARDLSRPDPLGLAGALDRDP